MICRPVLVVLKPQPSSNTHILTLPYPHYGHPNYMQQKDDTNPTLVILLIVAYQFASHPSKVCKTTSPMYMTLLNSLYVYHGTM